MSVNDDLEAVGDSIDVDEHDPLKGAGEAIDEHVPDYREVTRPALAVADRAMERVSEAVTKMAERFDLYGITTASFMFVIDGKVIGSFQSLEGMEVSYEPFEINEGGNNHSAIKRPTRMKWTNLKLTRGIAMIDTLFDWINKASGDGFSAGNLSLTPPTVGITGLKSGKNYFDAQTGALTLVSPLGLPLRAWWVREALPVRWTGPSFSASSKDGESVPVEVLEIAHEGLSSMTLPIPL